MLVQNERHHAFTQFAPDDETREEAVTDFISLSGDAEVAEVTGDSGAPIAGLTLAEAAKREILTDDTLVVAIERNDTVLTPHGDTEIRPDDIVTVFSRGGVADSTIETFRGGGDH